RSCSSWRWRDEVRRAARRAGSGTPSSACRRQRARAEWSGCRRASSFGSARRSGRGPPRRPSPAAGPRTPLRRDRDMVLRTRGRLSLGPLGGALLLDALLSGPLLMLLAALVLGVHVRPPVRSSTSLCGGPDRWAGPQTSSIPM